MARVHGKDISTITVHGTDLKAETISISDIGADVATHDTTTIGDAWTEFTAGLKTGKGFDHEFFFNNTNTTGSWAVYTGLLGASANVTIGDGTRTVVMYTTVDSLGLPISVNDMLKGTAHHICSGPVTFS